MDINELYSNYCNLFWVHFSDGAYSNRKTVTFQQWQQRTPAARKAMLRHLATNGAPKKNPFFWVQDFPEPAEPTNYFGKELARGVNYFTAIYNGKKGLYTAADVEFFEMQNPQPFNI